MTQLNYIQTVDALEALYQNPSDRVINKVTSEITPLCQKWIEASRICMLASVGPEGTDDTPRGDRGPVVQILDSKTVALPDWPGNNRLDTLRNIVRDGRVSLTFLVPGVNNVIRINGTAQLTDNAEMRARFDRDGRLPQTVILVSVQEVYGQCAQAFKTGEIWTTDDLVKDLPTVGELLSEALEWSAREAE